MTEKPQFMCDHDRAVAQAGIVEAILPKVSPSSELAECAKLIDETLEKRKAEEAKTMLSERKVEKAIIVDGSPAPGVVSLLKTKHRDFDRPKVTDPEYRCEIIQNNYGVRVVRYWDRDLAYLDAVIVQAGIKPVFTEWTLGDAFERCFAAHLAVATNLTVPMFTYIHHLEVRNDQQNKKIGTGLLRHFLCETRFYQREPWIWLAANDAKMFRQDRPLMAWYERFGFRRLAVGTVIMYWDRNCTQKQEMLDPAKPATEVAYMARPQ